MKKLTPFATGTLIVVAAFLWILSSVGEAATVQVDCSSGSLQAAIDKAKPGDTLLVSGTCKENLVIYEEVVRVTLDGQGKATINGPDATKSTIAVRGRGITIKGFTVTGGRSGIAVGFSGTAVIDSNTIQSTGGRGISVSTHSLVRIGNNTIQNNPRYGISVAGNSFALIGLLVPGAREPSPNIIQNNGRYGIRVARSSAARIAGNTISNNKRGGVWVTQGSNADIGNNTIDGNGRSGIFVIRNSNATLGGSRGRRFFLKPNTTTAPNTGLGIRCSMGGSVDGRLGTLNGTKGAKKFDKGCLDSLKP